MNYCHEMYIYETLALYDQLITEKNMNKMCYVDL